MDDLLQIVAQATDEVPLFSPTRSGKPRSGVSRSRIKLEGIEQLDYCRSVEPGFSVHLSLFSQEQW